MKAFLSILFVAIFFSGCVGSAVALPFKAAGKAIELTGDVVEAVIP
jgi:PBP1b-binding outer membrane lipoprotein LpoB